MPQHPSLSHSRIAGRCLRGQARVHRSRELSRMKATAAECTDRLTALQETFHIPGYCQSLDKTQVLTGPSVVQCRSVGCHVHKPLLTRPSQLNSAQGVPMRRSARRSQVIRLYPDSDYTAGVCLAGFWDASKKRVLLWATQRCREKKTLSVSKGLAQMGEVTVLTCRCLLLCAKCQPPHVSTCLR